jgi:hypothetical protein
MVVQVSARLQDDFKGPTHEKNMKACFEQLLRPSKKHESLLPKSDFDAEYVICSNTCKQENHIKCKLKSDVRLEAYKQTRKSNICTRAMFVLEHTGETM